MIFSSFPGTKPRAKLRAKSRANSRAKSRANSRARSGANSGANSRARLQQAQADKAQHRTSLSTSRIFTPISGTALASWLVSWCCNRHRLKKLSTEVV